MATLDYDHYSHVKASDWKWPNFSPEEMASNDTGELLLDTLAMDRLQSLRDRLAKPLIVISAYRTPAHNKAVGGKPNSFHKRGQAFDISMQNHDTGEFERAARDEGFTGFGFYPKKNMIHIDIGPAREWGTRWTKPTFGDDRPRSTLETNTGKATIAGTLTGVGATVADFAAENAEAALEAATSPQVQTLALLVDWAVPIVVGVGVLSLILILIRKRKMDRAE